jgi:hypothetical protein
VTGQDLDADTAVPINLHHTDGRGVELVVELALANSAVSP